MKSTLFTELTSSEQAILSGGKAPKNKVRTTSGSVLATATNIVGGDDRSNNGNFAGASGGAGSGGATGTAGSGSVSTGDGQSISN